MSLQEKPASSESSLADLKAALAERERDLAEARERELATAEVLKAISASSFDLTAVLDKLIESACRLCEADLGTIRHHDGDSYRLAATYGCLPEWRALFASYSTTPHPGSVFGQTIIKGGTVHIPDLLADPDYARPEAQKMMGLRTALGVPLLRQGRVFGVVILFRTTPRPFTQTQIELAETFAAQAVVAIENARLLSELRASLEQQTATSEVLKVIAGSSGELQPVFKAMLENATRLCGASYGAMWLWEGNSFRSAALHGPLPAEYAELVRRGTLSGPSTAMMRAARAQQPIQTPDTLKSAAYLERDPLAVAAVDVAGIRTLVAVPMFKEAEFVGVITIYRKEVRPFTEEQIELVQNFAAQAVIAIENARLLNELRQRTNDLTESLQQQTATSEILEVISNSPTDSQPAFDAIVRSGLKLFPDAVIVISLPDGDQVKLAAIAGGGPGDLEMLRARYPMPLSRKFITGSALLEGREMDFADAREAPEKLMPGRQNFLASGYRAITVMPMMRGQAAIGTISVVRRSPGALSEKQRELLRTFASQAVIAIENTRLFNELRQRTDDLTDSLEQQTATSEVLGVISSSPGELQPVFDAILASATHLCEAEFGVLNIYDGEQFRHGAARNIPAALEQYRRERGPFRPASGTPLDRLLRTHDVVHIADGLHSETPSPPSQFAGAKSELAVPMLKDDALIGAIIIYRQEVRPFTDKQIDLVTTFADQAVIAIENVRLFEEIQEKSRQLEEASKHKSQFLANMSHELRTPLNAILGYTELIVDGVYGETPQKVQDALKRITTNGKHLLGLINDVLDLSKIEAGQLTLSLSDYSMKEVVHAVYGAVEPLAAEKKLTFKAEIAPDMPAGHGDERRLTQVLLNLVGNAIKFTDAGAVIIKASRDNGAFLVRVDDTGPGISDDDQKKLFQEFQQADSSTTKKKGGTGLGLAISKKIIELHGGKIWLESQVGKGSTFAFTVPARAEQTERQA
jgi:signal transduction histidine kinase